jgi:uncharacterized membrane protein YedE/YeeE
LWVILIGLGSLLTMAASGEVPGISGITARILRCHSGDTAWRILFLVGLIGGAGVAFLSGIGWQDFSIPGGRNLVVMAVAGFLVGLGTRVGGGCTSGHGGGIGSGARDGLVYTLVFMVAGAATVLVWNFVNGRTAL